MKTLVQELRDLADILGPGGWRCAGQTVTRAAEEIDRLTAELARERERTDLWRSQALEWQAKAASPSADAAERERLGEIARLANNAARAKHRLNYGTRVEADWQSAARWQAVAEAVVRAARIAPCGQPEAMVVWSPDEFLGAPYVDLFARLGDAQEFAAKYGGRVQRVRGVEWHGAGQPA